LLIPHLGGGGAEQVTALLARGFPPERYDMNLALVTQAHADTASQPPWVHIHALGASRVRTAGLPVLRLVRQLKPDLILCGMAHLNFLVLLLRPFFPKTTRVLIRQNSTVSAALAFGDLPGFTRPLYRLLYHRADRIICQTNAMAHDLARELSVSSDLLAVLPNPIDIQAIRAASNGRRHNWTGPGPHLLAMGRLAPVKGFDLLLQALPAVRQRYPHADLLIAGAGPEEASLKSLALSLGLEHSVRFAGRLAQPWTCFPGASLFVLSSRHEGLPNALLEAAAAGLPLVTSPASEGVVDLLQGQPGVWIAPETTSHALAGSLLSALDVLKPGQRFPHPFIQQFGIEHALHAYESLIDTTLRESLP